MICPYKDFITSSRVRQVYYCPSEPAESGKEPPARVVVAGASSVQVVTLDEDLLREARQLEEHAARLLGEWIDKRDEKRLETLTDEQLERIAAGGDVAPGSGKGAAPKAPGAK